MKKFSKVLLLTLLTVMMVLNTCGIIALADVVATVTVTEEVVNAATGVKKLVFKVTAPITVQSTSVVFSYDNTVIQPVNKGSGNADVDVTSTISNTLKQPLKAYADPDDPANDNGNNFSLATPKYVINGNRTGVKADTYNDAGSFDATAGEVFTEFYFKVKEGQSPNSETFIFETEYADGTIYKEMCPDIGTAAVIKINTTSDEAFRYATPAVDEENITVSSFTYTGSDVLVLSDFSLSSTASTLAVPVVFPVQGSAATATVTATAMSTIGTEITDFDFSTAVWDLETPIAGVTLTPAVNKKSATLSVAPGAAAGEAKVRINAGGKSKTQSIDITRVAAVNTQAVIYDNGTATTSKTIVKPATSSAEDKNVTFTAKLFNQYGEEVTATPTWTNTNDLNNVTVTNGSVTVPYDAEEGTFTLTASYGGISAEVEITISGLEVNWGTIAAKAGLKYGVTYGETLDNLPATGTASDGTNTFSGNFSVVDGTVKPDAGTRTVTVKFTVTTAGEYFGIEITKDYTVVIGKADYNMAGVSLANKTVDYGTSAAVTLTGTLPQGVTAEIKYANADYPSSTTPPTKVGIYTVTASFTGDTYNYNAIADLTATLTIKDEQAVVTTEAPSKTATAYAARTLTTTDALKADMDLPATVEVRYGDNQTTTASVTWANATESYNAKGGTYTFVGTIADPAAYIKIKADNKTLTATYTVNASTATSIAWGTASEQTAIPASKSVKKAVLDAATTYADIGLYDYIKITLGEGDSGAEFTYDSVAYDKTVAAIKALNLSIGGSTTVTPVIGDLPAWMTVTLPTITINVTDKDPVQVNVTIDDTTYGTALAEPVATQTDEGYGTDPSDDYTFTYTGRGTTVYGPSETAPTAAGTYTVTATLDSVTLAGEGSADFTIAPFVVNYTINDATKVYGEDFDPATATGSFSETLPYGETEEDLEIEFACADTVSDPAGSTKPITATSSNTNYDVRFTNGTLTVLKKSLSTVPAPVITNTTVNIGDALAATVAGVAPSEYDLVWMVDGTEVENITVADAGKTLTVKAIAKLAGNYSGETAVSEPKTIADYTITGIITIDVINGASSDPDKVDADDTLRVNTSAIENFAELESVAGFTYVWTNIRSTGSEVLEETTDTFVIPDGFAGSIKVAITANGHYNGTIESAALEVNKTILAGAIFISGAAGVGDSLTASPTLNGVQGEDWVLAWYRGDTVIAGATGTSYTITTADLGQSITVKATAIGDAYTGEIVSNTIAVPALAPSNIEIVTSVSATAINVTLTADANGAAITQFDVTITDGTTPQTVQVTADGNGDFRYTFEGLSTGTTYTITATATNSAGTSAPSAPVNATPASASRPPRPSTPSTPEEPTKPEEPEEPTETPDLSVSVDTSEVVLTSQMLKGKEVVNTTTKTESGLAVKTTVDIKGKAVASLAVYTSEINVKALGLAAEKAIAEPIEIKALAKDAGGKLIDDIILKNVSIKTEKESYAYLIDEYGLPRRLEATYLTDSIVLPEISSGARIILSEHKPVEFIDIPTHWAYDYINLVADVGLVNGKSAEIFDSESGLTRAEQAKLIGKVADFANIGITPPSSETSIDTSESHWAYDELRTAFVNNWLTGTGTVNGAAVLNADGAITREQFVTTIWRVLGNPEVNDAPAVQFVDAGSISDWAKDAVAWAASANIISGSPDNGGFAFNAGNDITRAEASKIYSNILEYISANIKD
ncbi:MAG: S-layer homology domain-containing protein [Monoglobales bacterium]